MSICCGLIAVRPAVCQKGQSDRDRQDTKRNVPDLLGSLNFQYKRKEGMATDLNCADI